MTAADQNEFAIVMRNLGIDVHAAAAPAPSKRSPSIVWPDAQPQSAIIMKGLPRRFLHSPRSFWW